MKKSGYLIGCYHSGTNKQTNEWQTRKDRATQPLDHGRLRWAIRKKTLLTDKMNKTATLDSMDTIGVKMRLVTSLERHHIIIIWPDTLQLTELHLNGVGWVGVVAEVNIDVDGAGVHSDPLHSWSLIKGKYFVKISDPPFGKCYDDHHNWYILW